MTVRLGLIGLGYIGKVHLRNSKKLQNARLIAVADVSKNALKAAKATGVRRTFTNYEDLLRDPDVDGVIISLPTHLHLECARRAAEAGKHIFMEKPLARNVAEAEEIISAAKHHSVKLMVGYPLRFNDAFVKVKQEIDNGFLGDVEVAYATYIGSGPFFHRAEGYAPVPVPDWWFKKELTGGGAMVDLGSHMINLFRWYFGEVKDVQSHMGYRLNMDFEDSAVCMIRFKSGTLGVVSVGWFSQDYTLKADLFGSVKHCSVQHHPPNFLATAAQMLTLGTSKYYLPHLTELQHFTNCIINDTLPSPTGQDGLRDLEAIFLAYQNQLSLT